MSTSKHLSPTNTLGDRLYTLRRQHALSQQQVADHLHVSRQCYSHYENNDRLPSYDRIIALADLYQVTTDDILRGNARPGVCPPGSEQADPAAKLTSAKRIFV